MGTYSRTVCDRCGKEMVYHGCTSFLKGFRKFEVKLIYDGNPSGYDYRKDEIELCRECTKGLKQYLRNAKGGEDG